LANIVLFLYSCCLCVYFYKQISYYHSRVPINITPPNPYGHNAENISINPPIPPSAIYSPPSPNNEYQERDGNEDGDGDEEVEISFEIEVAEKKI